MAMFHGQNDWTSKISHPAAALRMLSEFVIHELPYNFVALI